MAGGDCPNGHVTLTKPGHATLYMGWQGNDQSRRLHRDPRDEEPSPEELAAQLKAGTFQSDAPSG